MLTNLAIVAVAIGLLFFCATVTLGTAIANEPMLQNRRGYVALAIGLAGTILLTALGLCYLFLLHR